MDKLEFETQVQVTKALCNSMGLRAITRTLDVHRTTVLRILERVGEHCEELHYGNVQGLELRSVQMDEMWTFVKKRGGRLTREEMHNTAIGDPFIFYGIDRDTKLIPGWAIGKRNGDTTNEFLRMMRNSIDNSPQFSADGFQAYPWNLSKHFQNPDLGVVIKNYAAIEAKRSRHASPEVQSITKKTSLGTPHLDVTCTS